MPKFTESDSEGRLTNLSVGGLVLINAYLLQINAAGASNGRAWDSLFNYETIKYFGAERRMDREIGDALRKWEKMATQSSAVRSVSGLATVLVLGGGVTLLLWMAGHQTLAGDMSVGGLVLINAYLLQNINHHAAGAYGANVSRHQNGPDQHGKTNGVVG